LFDIYEASKDWNWRFGETPSFTNSLEHKFAWALIEVTFNVDKGIITSGQCFSDCLVPAFID
jgi:lipoate-protein ligase A